VLAVAKRIIELSVRHYGWVYPLISEGGRHSSRFQPKRGEQSSRGGRLGSRNGEEQDAACRGRFISSRDRTTLDTGD